MLAIGVGKFALLVKQGLMRSYGDNIRKTMMGPMVRYVKVHHSHWREERAMHLVIYDVPTCLADISRRTEVDLKTNLLVVLNGSVDIFECPQEEAVCE